MYASGVETMSMARASGAGYKPARNCCIRVAAAKPLGTCTQGNLANLQAQLKGMLGGAKEQEIGAEVQAVAIQKAK